MERTVIEFGVRFNHVANLSVYLTQDPTDKNTLKLQPPLVRRGRVIEVQAAAVSILPTLQTHLSSQTPLSNLRQKDVGVFLDQVIEFLDSAPSSLTYLQSRVLRLEGLTQALSVKASKSSALEQEILRLETDRISNPHVHTAADFDSRLVPPARMKQKEGWIVGGG